MAEWKDIDSVSEFCSVSGDPYEELNEIKQNIYGLHAKVAELRSDAYKEKQKLKEEKQRHVATKEALRKNKKSLQLREESLQNAKAEIESLLIKLKEYESNINLMKKTEKELRDKLAGNGDKSKPGDAVDELQLLKQKLYDMTVKLQGMERIEKKLGKVEHALQKSEAKNEELETKVDQILSWVNSQTKVSPFDSRPSTHDSGVSTSNDKPLPPITPKGDKNSKRPIEARRASRTIKKD